MVRSLPIIVLAAMLTGIAGAEEGGGAPGAAPGTESGAPGTVAGEAGRELPPEAAGEGALRPTPPTPACHQFSFFPALFYTPETSFGFGGGGVLAMRREGCAAEERPSTISLFAVYTAKNQTTVALAPEFYLDGGDWQAGGTFGYTKFPARFYGVGNDLPEDAEETYTSEAAMFKPSVLRRLWGPLHLGLTYDLKRTTILDYEEGGQIAGRQLTGRRGGVRSGGGPVIGWDTRENIFYPLHGSWYQIVGWVYRDALGSDFDYEYQALDLRHYLHLGGARVLAVRAFGTRLSGEVPFEELAPLGEELRGLNAERYRDRQLGTLQAEFRLPLSRLVRLAVFAGAGQVAARREDWRLADVKLTGGAGMRYVLNPAERTAVRIDFGFGDEGLQVYVQFGEAF